MTREQKNAEVKRIQEALGGPAFRNPPKPPQINPPPFDSFREPHIPGFASPSTFFSTKRK